jgi:hypothetical protein
MKRCIQFGLLGVALAILGCGDSKPTSKSTAPPTPEINKDPKAAGKDGKAAAGVTGGGFKQGE